MEDINRPVIATIEWRMNSAGVVQPFPKYVEAATKETMTALHWAAMSMPYKGKRDPETGDFVTDFERECDGRRNIEVIARRKAQLAAEGETSMIKYVEDRSLGKPMQTNQNVNLQVSWSEMTKSFRHLDETEPMKDPPTRIPIMVEVSRDYDLADEEGAEDDDKEDDQDHEPLDGEIIEIADADLLLDPLAGM